MVGLEEGNLDVVGVLGVPSSTVNVPHHMFESMQKQVRRASPRMFDPCIGVLEGSSMFQHVDTEFFQALSCHITAEVTGPYPTE